MITAKDCFADDLASPHAWFDDTVFVEYHEVNGKRMLVQIDSFEAVEREKRFSQTMDGASANQVLIYVRAVDFGPLPAQGTWVTLDGVSYRVADAVDEAGVYSITLNRTMDRGYGFGGGRRG